MDGRCVGARRTTTNLDFLIYFFNPAPLFLHRQKERKITPLLDHIVTDDTP